MFLHHGAAIACVSGSNNSPAAPHRMATAAAMEGRMTTAEQQSGARSPPFGGNDVGAHFDQLPSQKQQQHEVQQQHLLQQYLLPQQHPQQPPYQHKPYPSPSVLQQQLQFHLQHHRLQQRVQLQQQPIQQQQQPIRQQQQQPLQQQEDSVLRQQQPPLKRSQKQHFVQQYAQEEGHPHQQFVTQQQHPQPRMSVPQHSQQRYQQHHLRQQPHLPQAFPSQQQLPPQTQPFPEPRQSAHHSLQQPIHLGQQQYPDQESGRLQHSQEQRQQQPHHIHQQQQQARSQQPTQQSHLQQQQQTCVQQTCSQAQLHLQQHQQQKETHIQSQKEHSFQQADTREQLLRFQQRRPQQQGKTHVQAGDIHFQLQDSSPLAKHCKAGAPVTAAALEEAKCIPDMNSPSLPRPAEGGTTAWGSDGGVRPPSAIEEGASAVPVHPSARSLAASSGTKHISDNGPVSVNEITSKASAVVVVVDAPVRGGSGGIPLAHSVSLLSPPVLPSGRTASAAHCCSTTMSMPETASPPAGDPTFLSASCLPPCAAAAQLPPNEKARPVVLSAGSVHVDEEGGGDAAASAAGDASAGASAAADGGAGAGKEEGVASSYSSSGICAVASRAPAACSSGRVQISGPSETSAAVGPPSPFSAHGICSTSLCGAAAAAPATASAAETVWESSPSCSSAAAARTVAAVDEEVAELVFDLQKTEAATAVAASFASSTRKEETRNPEKAREDKEAMAATAISCFPCGKEKGRGGGEEKETEKEIEKEIEKEKEDKEEVVLDVEETQATAAAAAATQPDTPLHPQTGRCAAAEQQQQKEKHILQPLTQQQRRHLTAHLTCSANALQRWVEYVRYQGDNIGAAFSVAGDSVAAARSAAAIELLREALLLLPPAALFADLEPLNGDCRTDIFESNPPRGAAEDGEEAVDVSVPAPRTDTAATSVDKRSGGDFSPPERSARFLPAAGFSSCPDAAAAADLRYRLAEKYMPNASDEEDTLLDEVFPFGPADPYSILYTSKINSEKAEEAVASFSTWRDRYQSEEQSGISESSCNARRSNGFKTSSATRSSARRTSSGEGFIFSISPSVQLQQTESIRPSAASTEIETFSPQTGFPLSSDAAMTVWEALQAEQEWLPWELPPSLDKAHAAAWIREQLRSQRCAAREWRSLRLWTLECAAAATPFTADYAFDPNAAAFQSAAGGACAAGTASVPSPTARATAGWGEPDEPLCGAPSAESEGPGALFTCATNAELQWLRQERMKTWRCMERKRRNLQGCIIEEDKKQQEAAQQRLLAEVLTAKRRRRSSPFLITA